MKRRRKLYLQYCFYNKIYIRVKIGVIATKFGMNFTINMFTWVQTQANSYYL
jgi:hypothetical protein